MPSADIVQLPVLSRIPEPSVPLGQQASKLFNELCQSYYDKGLLTEMTLAQIESVAICRDQIVKALEAGKPVKGNLLTQWGLLMRPFVAGKNHGQPRVPTIATRDSQIRGLRRDVALPPIKVDVSGDGDLVEFPDYPGMAIWYAENVVSHRIATGRRTIQCAERFMRMMDRATSDQARWGKDDIPYTWSPDDVVDVCAHEERIQHVEGFRGDLQLDPWQMFGNALIWGFRKENGFRLVRFAYEWEPRGAGKSFRGGTRLSFCMACEGEPGPLGYICGAKDDHALKVFTPLKKVIETQPAFREQFCTPGLKPATEHILRLGGGTVERVTEVPNEDEGHNPHVVVMEELHKQKVACGE